MNLRPLVVRCDVGCNAGCVYVRGDEESGVDGRGAVS